MKRCDCPAAGVPTFDCLQCGARGAAARAAPEVAEWSEPGDEEIGAMTFTVAAIASKYGRKIDRMFRRHGWAIITGTVVTLTAALVFHYIAGNLVLP